ncbi:hypothetical protein [Dactylosporangium cerinum]
MTIDVGPVHDDLTALVAGLRCSGDVADEAMAGFLAGFLGNLAARGSTGAVDVMIRLPLLVHAAETGDPAGAGRRRSSTCSGGPPPATSTTWPTAARSTRRGATRTSWRRWASAATCRTGSSARPLCRTP